MRSLFRGTLPSWDPPVAAVFVFFHGREPEFKERPGPTGLHHSSFSVHGHTESRRSGSFEIMFLDPVIFSSPVRTWRPPRLLFSTHENLWVPARLGAAFLAALLKRKEGAVFVRAPPALGSSQAAARFNELRSEPPTDLRQVHFPSPAKTFCCQSEKSK